MTWIRVNLDVIAQAVLAHLTLVLPAVIFSLLISIPIAFVSTQHRKLRELTLTTTGLLYAIPSLPMLVLIPVLIGIPLRSNTNVHVVLTIYGCALLIRSSADAFDSVDCDVLASATATGYGPARKFFTVHLPLAGPAIIAGLRVVSVTLMSLTTVAAVLGVTSLGSLFTDGFQRGIAAEVLTGIILTVLLALVIDFAIVMSGHLLLPFTRRSAGQQPRSERATVTEAGR